MTRSNELIGKVCRILEKEYSNAVTQKHYKDIISRYILKNKLETMDELFSEVTNKKDVKRIIAKISNIEWGKWEEQKEYIKDAQEKIHAHYTSENSYRSTASAIKVFIRHLKIYNNSLFINKPTLVIRELRDYKRKKETKKRILWAIIYSIIHLPAAKDAVIKYKTKAKQIRLAIEDEVKENKIRSKVEKNASHIDYLQLKKKPINKKVLTQKELIYNMLIHQRHTPRLEYRLIKVYDKLPKDFKGNAIVKNKRGNFKMTLNDYKGKRHHGVWEFLLNKQLSNYIVLYLKEHSIKSGDNLFLSPIAKKVFKSGGFSKFISNAFKKKVGLPINMNIIRRLKVNHLFYKNARFHKQSTKKQEELSIELFRHKLAVSQAYYKRVK